MQGLISSVGNIDLGGQGGAGDSFVKLVVDLTNITPTTETINNKEYKKFTFSLSNLTFKTITPFGDEDTLDIDDALIYNLLPISNNNDDKGVNISYDGNTFVGYVLAQESTLTTVTFMFSYYIILTQTSVDWKNYVDMVRSGGSSLQLKKLRKQYTATFYFPQSYVTEFFVQLPQNVQTISDLKNYIINNGAYTEYNPKGNASSVQMAYIPCCMAERTIGASNYNCGMFLLVKRSSLYPSNTVVDNDWNTWDNSNIELSIIYGAGSTASYITTIDNTWDII